MIGEPVTVSAQSRPSNLSSRLEANRRQIASWPSPRTLTQKRPAPWIFGQLVDALSGKKATSGGSSETEVNEPTASPARSPSGVLAVITQTPVGYWPRTSRNQR